MAEAECIRREDFHWRTGERRPGSKDSDGYLTKQTMREAFPKVAGLTAIWMRERVVTNIAL